jgi:hypothetical protein
MGGGVNVEMGTTVTSDGDHDDAHQLTRERKTPYWLTAVFIGGEVTGAISGLVGSIISHDPNAFLTALIFMFVYGFFFLIYWSRNYIPQVTIDWDARSIRETVAGQVVTEIPTSSAVTADVIIKDWLERDPRHGPLYGYRFFSGDHEVRMSPRNHWDLWTIQQSWDRFWTFVQEHKLRKGDDLKRYLNIREGLLHEEEDEAWRDEPD